MTFTPILWAAMRNAEGSRRALREVSVHGTAEQLILLHRRIDDAADELYPQPGFVEHADPGAAVALSRWAVTQGESFWKQAKRDPAVLPKRPPADGWDAMAVLEEVYRARFGEEIPTNEPVPIDAYRYDPAWEATLWDVVSVLGVGVPIDEALGGFTRTELVKLAAARSEVTERLRQHAKQHFGEDPAGLDWAFWAAWLPLEGKAVHDAVFADPASVPKEVPDDGTLLSDEINEVYLARYGTRIEIP